jgi:SAM-dependent methyltransferase/uncharacterized protein YbaR (Trm112 family)
MAQVSFLADLRCPYCGGALELDTRHPARAPDVEFGTLRCRCYRYPVVLGIPVLRQASLPNDNSDPIVAALDKGDREGAAGILLAGDSGRRGGRRATVARIVERLRGRSREQAPRSFSGSENLRAVLRQWRPDYYGEYLEYRYGNPSLLAALPVIAALTKALACRDGTAGRPCVLDLGCGIGQTSYLLRSLAPGLRIVSGDVDFLNLVLAKHYVVPEGNFVCFDAEAGLPFAGGTFDAAFSLDCVHYIRGKARLAAELRRTARPNAHFALCHLHNVEHPNPNQGIPLSADGYSEVFGSLGGRLHDEPALLESFGATGSLALDRAADRAGTAANAFTYLSLGEDKAEWASTHLDRHMATRLMCFSLNGLYEGVGVDGGLELRMRWPSEKLRSECSAGFQPLEERVLLERSLADAVLGQRLHELPTEAYEGLIRSFVVVPQPSCLRTPS